MSDRCELLRNLENELNNLSCQSCGHLNKNNVISITNEMEFCQQIILQENDQFPELARQSELAKSHLTWMRYFCKKMLNESSE